MTVELVPVPSETVNDVQSNDVHKLVKRHAPILYFDRLEPFLPCAVGYTVFTSDAESASFKRHIKLPEGVNTAIEYAIWWDWDIQHLYELEHLWIYLDKNDKLVYCEGSFHGKFHVLEPSSDETSSNQPSSESGRAKAYSEPGKHAFFANPSALADLRHINQQSCGKLAGKGDVLINDMFADVMTASAQQRRLCKRYMQAHAFDPSYEFGLRVDVSSLPLLPWDALKAWIPQRITSWLELLEHTLPYIQAVLLDSGDTLIDEGTEVKDDDGIVLSASLIPTADELIKTLKQQGYPLALVADGEVQSFKNVLGQHGLFEQFDVHVISETVGVLKPDEKMFVTALEALNLSDSITTVMVGNNLARDIKGANALGITSVWLDWAPRRSKVPENDSERPDYSIKLPIDLVDVLASLEIEVARAYLQRNTPQPTHSPATTP
ncbi:MAG: HAD family hydrolase [Deinococcota bacterium]